MNSNQWVLIEASFSNRDPSYDIQKNKIRSFLKTKNSSIVEQLSRMPEKSMMGKVGELWDAGSWLQRYGVESCVGVGLMMLAEALLRLPNKAARREYIKDLIPKMQEAGFALNVQDERLLRYAKRLGKGGGFVQSVTDGLMKMGAGWLKDHPQSGQVVLEQALLTGLSFMSQRFVSAQDVEKIPALLRSGKRYSFDMLGEAALTQAEAQEYEHLYHACLTQLIEQQKKSAGSYSMSVKLTALHPLFECVVEDAAVQRVTEVLWGLVQRAQEHQIMLTVDAEEAHRLRLMLSVVDNIMERIDAGYTGFGCAVQANLKSAHSVLLHLKEKSEQLGKKLSVRLVKGAYWDGEVKAAVNGGYDHVVWESKEKTDQNYLVCAQTLLETPWCYPMFGTHNVHTILSVKALAEHYDRNYEFQRLEGMGEQEYLGAGVEARVYAPVGASAALLPYLARRMLENGSGNSMLRARSQGSVREAHQSPFEKSPSGVLRTYQSAFVDRRSAYGYPLWQYQNEAYWRDHLRSGQFAVYAGGGGWVHQLMDRRSHASAKAFCEQQVQKGEAFWVYGVNGLAVGIAQKTSSAQMKDMVHSAHQKVGSLTPQEVHEKLKKASVLLERYKERIVSVIMLEGGKVLKDAIGEWREAFDFCEYHAVQVLKVHQDQKNESLVGEQNKTTLVPRGVALCISPWNFGFAICMGQVTGALGGLCPVLVKGSSQSTLSAQMVVSILKEAGFEACDLVVCSGSEIQQVMRDVRIGVCAFTGSTEVSVQCQKFLLDHNPGCKWIAETGGFNVMLIDRSAHLHFAVQDVLESAFNMAGQRCSALRAVWVDKSIAPAFLRLLGGAMQVRCVESPLENIHAQFGPLINEGAVQSMRAAQKVLEQSGAKLVGSMGVKLPREPEEGVPHTVGFGAYAGGVVYEVSKDQMLCQEVFAPLLQVYAYESPRELVELMDAQKSMGGYGLTFGVQTRRPDVAAWCAKSIPAGNIYINRSMIGAMVGVQPFGGMGLSGSGPKIGGEHYLAAFCHEKTISHNTAVYGGARDVLSHNVQYLHEKSDGSFPWDEQS